MKNNTKKWHTIYHTRLSEIGYESDPAQLAVINEFARIEYELANEKRRPAAKKGGLFSRFFTAVESNSTVPTSKGLYLFGTVGRGKTFLLDLFCQHVVHSVIRLHFHHFMQDIHSRLKTIKEQQNPLSLIADDIAARYRIVCLDEFMVTDITDAMLLYGLIKNLIDRDVVIITTTNIAPDDLYKDGLQRARFLPAIALIKQCLVIHEIAGEQDYRRLCLARHDRFFSPLSPAVDNELHAIMRELSADLPLTENASISVNGRAIDFVARSESVIWFRFADLCEGYRSQLDYIELAKAFSVFMVSDIPVLDEFKEDAAKRFLLLFGRTHRKHLHRQKNRV